MQGIGNHSVVYIQHMEPYRQKGGGLLEGWAMKQCGVVTVMNCIMMCFPRIIGMVSISSNMHEKTY